ncbi:hypothetical protein F5Y11DRAFT_335566 [Daldinia sp. FL1419]|nr:hypothetical protein F5Y11DRAFT_335566 [Daldinia sp. FL1419]
MQKSILPLLCQLFALAQGQGHRQPVGNWTLWNASRSRSAGNETCHWNFQFTQSEARSSNPTICRFEVGADDGHNCDTTSFSGIACSGTERYSVNGGHAPEGFIVMVLLDIEENVEAYFGFDDKALNSGAHIPEQIMAAYPPTAPKPSGAPSLSKIPELEGYNITLWTVENMYRGMPDSCPAFKPAGR